MASIFKSGETLYSKQNSIKDIFDIEPAEVVDIINNSKHPKYKSDLDLYSIVYRKLFSDFKKKENELSIARPLNRNHFQLPLKYETVLIINCPVPISGELEQQVGTYYFQNVCVWGEVNHNMLPFYTAPNLKLKEIKPGETFIENFDIPQLTLFEGDIVYQSRFGSSIRFGSISGEKDNEWSKDGKKGSPILIIRNDSKTNENNFIIESINESENIVALCSGQKLSLVFSCDKIDLFVNGDSFVQTKDYNGLQEILNSDRININAKTDDIVMSAKKHFVILSNNSVNIGSKKYLIIDSAKIYLGKGSETEKEPMVLGTQLLNTLTEMIDILLSMTFPTAVGPTGTMLAPALVKFNELKNKLNNIKPILSKINFLK